MYVKLPTIAPASLAVLFELATCPIQFIVKVLWSWLNLLIACHYSSKNCYRLKILTTDLNFVLRKYLLVPFLTSISLLSLGWNCSFPDSNSIIWRSASTLTREELLCKFFEFYSNASLRNYVLCTLTGIRVEKKHFLKFYENLPPVFEHYKFRVKRDVILLKKIVDDFSGLCIQDPFDHCHNLTKTINYVKFHCFVKLCRSTANILENCESCWHNMRYNLWAYCVFRNYVIFERWRIWKEKNAGNHTFVESTWKYMPRWEENCSSNKKLKSTTEKNCVSGKKNSPCNVVVGRPPHLHTPSSRKKTFFSLVNPPLVTPLVKSTEIGK